MKKKLIIMLAMLTTITLVSCEKEYTCSCREVDTSTGQVTKYWTPQKGTYTKSDAETWCYGQEVSGFGIEIKCDLK
ncbi:MAG: hypothetical protein BGO69_17075 [Bacteroidetes bacterium 46-16]|nr:MAG: hypothetical protein BGO69_17075 [Bacteroidetes bacterium 46-16]